MNLGIPKMETTGDPFPHHSQNMETSSWMANLGLITFLIPTSKLKQLKDDAGVDGGSGSPLLMAPRTCVALTFGWVFHEDGKAAR